MLVHVPVVVGGQMKTLVPPRAAIDAIIRSSTARFVGFVIVSVVEFVPVLAEVWLRNDSVAGSITYGTGSFESSRLKVRLRVPRLRSRPHAAPAGVTSLPRASKIAGGRMRNRSPRGAGEPSARRPGRSVGCSEPVASCHFQVCV